MKISIDLEVGEVTGAIAGILDAGISETKQNLGLAHPDNVDLIIRAIRHAETGTG